MRLDRASRSVDIVDEISGGDHDVRLAFHFGPEVEVEVDRGFAILRWPNASIPGIAMFELAQPLRWSMHRGETDPIMGWYSCGLGRRTPAVTLIGEGRSDPARPFVTRLEFLDVRAMAKWQDADSVLSGSPPGATAREMPDIQAEAG